MPLRATYYDFFGVSRTASAEEIRSAYVLLMKQYHPDLSIKTDPQRASDFAAILNRCYRVLRDPEKRARYDALLAHQSTGARKTTVRRRPLLTGETQRGTSKRWDASSKGAAFVAAMSAVLVATVVWAPIGPLAPRIEGAAMASSTTTRLPPISGGDDFRQQVRRAMTSTSDQAELVSRRCFASAREAASSAEMDLCVVFDDAYLDWNDATPVISRRPAYFNNTVVRLRHINAMDAVDSSPKHLDQLRQIALNALLREVRSEVIETPNSSTLQIEAAANPDQSLSQ